MRISVECVRGLTLACFLSTSQQARLNSRPDEAAALIHSSTPPLSASGRGSGSGSGRRAMAVSNSTLQSAGAASTRSGGSAHNSSLVRFSLFRRSRLTADPLRLKLQLDNSSGAARRVRTSEPSKWPTLAKSDPILLAQAASSSAAPGPGPTELQQPDSGFSGDSSSEELSQLERKTFPVAGLVCELENRAPNVSSSSSSRAPNRSERIFSDALLILTLKRKSKHITSKSYTLQQLLRLDGGSSPAVTDERSAEAQRTQPLCANVSSGRPSDKTACILSSDGWLQLGICTCTLIKVYTDKDESCSYLLQTVGWRCWFR